MARAAASTGNAMRSPAATLMLRFIQPAEILEHHAALLGRETGQLVPGGIADFRSRAGRAGAQRGRNVDAVADRGATRAILVLVRLVAGEAATRVQQLPVQVILPLDRPRVEPARLELARELASLVGQRARGARIATRSEERRVGKEGRSPWSPY